MNKRPKQIFKKIVSSHPLINSLMRRIFYRKIFSIIHGKNNTISYENALLSSVIIDIRGDGNTIDIQEGCILNNVTFRIRGNGHKVLINRGCQFKRGGNIWLEDSHCSLIIGKNSTFADVHLAVTEPDSQIVIGHDCMFAYDIDVRTGDSHSIISKESNERINYAEDITIGNHVWIAAHSTLLKGSVIPDESVVATGSIVTEKYNTTGIIIGGNPAKKLKDGITWTRKRIYKRSTS